MHCQSKVPPKDSLSAKESPALSAMKSPGVSSAMSSLQLDESPSPNVASVDPKLSFSTSNPNIFAPDLSCRDSTNTMKPDTQGSLSAPERSLAFNQYPQGQSLMMLKNRQEFIRLQMKMSNSQTVYGRNNFQYPPLNPSFQQSKSLMFNQALGHMNPSSPRNHSLLTKASANTHSHSESPSLHSTSDAKPMKLPYHHQEHQLRQQTSDILPKTALERQEQIRQPPITDKSYIEILRAKYPGSAFVSQLETALADEDNTKNMIKEAMEAQMRSFHERMRREQQTSTDTSGIDEKRDSKPAAVKSNLSITQSQVANLRNQSKSAKDRYPKAVRRASAA